MSSETLEQHPHLLVVEDDARLARALCRNLELEGFATTWAARGEEALDALRSGAGHFALVILDIMLPGIDGLEVCRRMRSAGSSTAVLFLTARGSDADRILGLRLGADDYLTKPFVFEELVLRVRGILRRTDWSSTPPSTGATLSFGHNTVDLATMTATTPRGEISLTEREVMLLRFLAENHGKVVSRSEILHRVWGYTFDTATRTLDTFVHRLRKYFEDEPQRPSHFHTRRGVGYRFTFEPDD